jgi:ABC-2 type transport system permease protein
MINVRLFKKGIQSNYITVVIFIGVLAMYFSMIIYMFDPKLGATLEQMVQAMPQLMALFNMDQAGSTLTSFITNYLYGFLMVLFPMVLVIMLANRLVAKLVDTGSMAYLLAAPRKRMTVVMTQWAVLQAALLTVILFSTLFGIAESESMFSGQLDIQAFLRLNIGAFFLHFAIGGICFFASCISNETKQSLGIGAGVSILFYLISMLSNMGGKLDFLKYTTIISLYDEIGLSHGDSGAIINLSILAAIGIILSAAGMFAFAKEICPCN